MRKGLSFIALLLLFFSASCSSDKGRESAQQPAPRPENEVSSAPAGGGLSLKITPETGKRGSTFFVVVPGFGIGDAKIEWSVNGSPVPVPSPEQFRANEVRKGDKIQVKATINGKEISSDVVTITNSAPEIAEARIVVESGSAVSAEATVVRDADGDSVTLQYEWTVNSSQAGSERRLSRPLNRGDYVSVKITPYDGEDFGRPLVLQRIIGNMSPVVRNDREAFFDGRVYTYQISAFDPDGDTLSYSLKSGPPGMTVDPSTGLVRWVVPKDFAGKAPAVVVVSDGHGGETAHNFNAIIRLEK